MNYRLWRIEIEMTIQDLKYKLENTDLYRKLKKNFQKYIYIKKN